MRMNDHDIDQAWQRWSEHPVLGPAIRTVANVRDMANQNSDGWAYWQAPAKACAGLMELIERDGTARYAHDSERADATVEEYKRALRAVKSFRTRQCKTEHRGPGPGYWFDICEPGPLVGGPVWIARLELEDAMRDHNRVQVAEQAAGELVRRAHDRLALAEREVEAQNVLRRLRQRIGADPGDAKLAALLPYATPGTRMWVLPDLCASGGFEGFGEFGVSLGMTAPDEHGLVVIGPAGKAWQGKHHAAGRYGMPWLRVYPSVVSTAEAAREHWWIVQGANLVSGGSPHRERIEALRDERFPGCEVVQGHEFIPPELTEDELRMARRLASGGDYEVRNLLRAYLAGELDADGIQLLQLEVS
jgi:hypothetical protein